MKNSLFILGLIIFAACGSNTGSTSKTDSMNAIEDHPLTDTVVGPGINGYAPPNASIDTSQYRKDSIKARDSADAAKQ